MTAEQLHKDVFIGSRVVTELGADAIKTFNIHDFKAVTSSCPATVFDLGAERLPTQRDALLLAQREVESGAGGVGSAVEGRGAYRAAGRACGEVPWFASVTLGYGGIFRQELPHDCFLRFYLQSVLTKL